MVSESRNIERTFFICCRPLLTKAHDIDFIKADQPTHNTRLSHVELHESS